MNYPWVQEEEPTPEEVQLESQKVKVNKKNGPDYLKIKRFIPLEIRNVTKGIGDGDERIDVKDAYEDYLNASRKDLPYDQDYF